MEAKNSEITPYILGKRQWNFQIAQSYRSLWVWRILAIIGLSGALLITIFSYQHMTKPKMIPIILTVTNNESGIADIQFKGVVQNQKLTITDAIIRNYLIRLITHIRVISSDVVILKDYLVDAYSICTKTAQNQITDMIVNEKIFELQKQKRRRDIRITQFQRILENTWSVEWIEEIRNEGQLEDKVPKAGTFTYTTILPETELQAENNPIGIFFTEFSFSEKR